MTATAAKKVLVVDDDPDAQIFISNLLTAHGFDPILAATRAEGLRKTIDEKPVLILIDMMMRREEGIQMYLDLKRDERLRHVPVIMLATIERRLFLKWRKIHSPDLTGLASDAYLEKPIEAEELIRLAKKLSRVPAMDPAR